MPLAGRITWRAERTLQDKQVCPARQSPNRGRSLRAPLKAGEYKRGMEDIQAAIRLNPQNTGALAARGDRLRARHRRLPRSEGRAFPGSGVLSPCAGVSQQERLCQGHR
jgi:hypothetical protein